ncbi:Cytochrome 71A2 [Capsicum annuum]|nr:Cytochrome 71A2 [Capsicum annuum]KAF3677424.1 Cytochrome 71A2 [Capsicum annuum]
MDTTYTALEWIMTELLRHPRAMEKLQNKVRGLAQGKAQLTEDDLGNMHYLKAVVKETLSLQPPIPLLTIGRDPLSWDDLEDYRPERFLNSNIDVKELNFELVPFGAGRRGCLGAAFATVTNELALARLVHKF